MGNYAEMEKLIDSTIKKSIDNNEVAGMNLLVVKDGKEVIYTEQGKADIGENKDFKRDTIIRLYSQSKPVTAAAVMKLMEDGVIDLTQAVSDFLPGFKDQYYLQNGEWKKLESPMLVYHLLSMTSGLSYPAEDNINGVQVDKIFKEADSRLYTDNAMTTMELCNAIGKCVLSYRPGSSWMYGTSADVLGAVVESASGMKFSEYLNKNIFEPLGMKDTAFWVPEDKQDRLARTYETVWDENGNTKDMIEYTGDNLLIMNRMKTQPAFESGGAGLASTLDDYMKFATMLNNNGTYEGVQILKPETVRYMISPTLRESSRHGFNWVGLEGYSYGNLLRVCKDPSLSPVMLRMGEYGWDGWLGPYFANFPNENMTILMGMQKRDAGTWTLTRKLRNIILSNVLE